MPYWLIRAYLSVAIPLALPIDIVYLTYQLTGRHVAIAQEQTVTYMIRTLFLMPYNCITSGHT